MPRWRRERDSTRLSETAIAEILAGMTWTAAAGSVDENGVFASAGYVRSVRLRRVHALLEVDGSLDFSFSSPATVDSVWFLAEEEGVPTVLQLQFAGIGELPVAVTIADHLRIDGVRIAPVNWFRLGFDTTAPEVIPEKVRRKETIALLRELARKD